MSINLCAGVSTASQFGAIIVYKLKYLIGLMAFQEEHCKFIFNYVTVSVCRYMHFSAVAFGVQKSVSYLLE